MKALINGLLIPVLMLGVSSASLEAQQVDHDFFEARIRPVLIQNCVSCHGPDQQEAGLRLDTAAGLKAGGDSGSIIAVDDPAHSMLVEVIQYDGDIQMPPDGRLKDEVIADLKRWVEAGTPWPESTAALTYSLEERMANDRQNHWSFQPIAAPKLPQVQDPAWQQNPIDALIASQLEKNGLSPSEPANERILVRRLYFDLLGLPPRPEELQQYQDSPSPQRWSELIDQILQRPQYGERWGRYWLDVARYADTQGYAFAKDRRYPHAYTYRDYVIDAFNQDKPFDQFVMEQLAADQMELGDDNSELAALGFITVGRRFINGHDNIDDRIDVVTRGLLGLTVSCARCHDHKYDAIPAEDYYSLYGVFASTREPGIKPVIGPLEKVKLLESFEAKQRELQGQLDQFRNAKVEQQKQATRERLQDYLFAMVAPPEGMNIEQVDQRVSLNETDLRPRMVRRWRDRFNHYRNDTNPQTAVFRPFAHLMNLPEEAFAEKAKLQIDYWQALLGETPPEEKPEGLNHDRMSPFIVAKLQAANLQTRKDVAAFYADLIRQVWTTFEEHGSNDKAVLEVEEPLRLIIDLKRKPDSPWNIPAGEIGLFVSDDDHQELQRLEKQLDDHNATAPPPLPRAMAVEDNENMYQPYVFLRGSDGNRGPEVPRRYLALLTSGERQPYPDNASGRLQLAQQIVAPDNPLTARVLANRIWMHHFGAPLVDTPSDFGIRCEEPVQRELLDYLAWYLQDQNWSVKALHRLILNSRTYQQQSWDREDGLKQDPENRLYWRMNRRRKDWESLRDSLYAATGQLDLTAGGPSVDMFRSQPSNRRSVYGTIDRQDLPNLLRSFDFASPDSSSARRPETTVPQQALFLMNGPVLSGLADQMLNRPDCPPLDQPDQRLAWLFQQIYLREMTGHEYDTCRKFVDGIELPTEGENVEQLQNEVRQKRWSSLVQALLMSNEFCFVD